MVRVALVSPYSYTYPGGVGQHVEALAEELLRQGHDVRLLAPCDPDDRFARVLHRGASPRRRPLPDYLIPLGRTLGVPMNGAVSNLPYGPDTISVLGHELRQGGYDVVHIHEPNAPVASWYATENAPMPAVATFHTYSTNRVSNGLAANFFGARRFYGKLSARIAVSEAAAWTARRLYGGRHPGRPPGRPAVSRAAATGSFRTAWTSRPRGRQAATPTARSTSSSSAAPRSARASRSCCARSRRCAALASTRA